MRAKLSCPFVTAEGPLSCPGVKAARRAKRRALGGEAKPQAGLSARRFKTTESSPSARFSWLTNFKLYPLRSARIFDRLSTIC